MRALYSFQLLALAFVLGLCVTDAQTIRRRIAFPKSGPAPPGFEKYNPADLSPGTGIVKGSASLPAPFRSFVKKRGGFEYTINTKPAEYRVKLGFLEFSKCTTGARVFQMTANGKSTPPIDVFDQKGCNQPLFRVIGRVQAIGGVIKIGAVPVNGFAPFLANVQIIETGSLTAVPPQASPRVASVVFSNGATPPGWTKHVPANLDGGVQFSRSRAASLALHFRSTAAKAGGFKYEHTVPPGTYRVTLGFAEYFTNACRDGRRVFKATVNNKGTRAIDTFKAVGCKKAHTRSVGGVVVSEDGKLIITMIPVSGLPPFLANFRVVRLTSAPPPPSPIPGASESSVPSTPASPVPDASASSAPAAPSSASPVPSVAPPGGSQTIVRDLDAAGATDKLSAVTGRTTAFSNVFPIEGTTQDARYSRHRYGADFTYVINVNPNVVYNVLLSFAEAFQPGCRDGFRIFDVYVYDGESDKSTGKTIRNLDVFKEAGCRTALSRSINGIGIGSSGKIALGFKSSVNNAMISAFQITTSDTAFVPPSPTPDTPSGPAMDSAEVNVGGPGDITLPGTRKEVISDPVMPTANVNAEFLKSSRVGPDFTYSFNLTPGAYDVVLVFSENFARFCSGAGKRVFNVYVNEMIQLESFDIFEQAGGCRKGVEVTLKGQTVGAVETKPLTIRFSGIVNKAQINYIIVEKAKAACVPASTSGELAADHAAHSVPGSYPPQLNVNSPRTYVDSDGDGFVPVTIDGRGSHSHFFDSANNIIGRITDYTWSIAETGEVVSRKQSFTYRFPLGTTRLKLSVTDNSCTTDEAETTVTVTGAIQAGQYCYFYDGLDELPKIGEEGASQNPAFAAVVQSATLGFPSFSFSDTQFAVKCTFFLEVNADAPLSEISVSTFGSGIARVYKGEDIILDTATSDTAETSLAVGLTGFEVVYLRTTLSATPKLHFLVDGAAPAAPRISHDRKMVVPILTSATPAEGPIRGGTMVKVTGYGLFTPFTVKFAGETVTVLDSGQSPTQFFVKSPTVASAGPVEIRTSGTEVSSNALTFTYGGAESCDSIGFTRTELKKANGSPLDTLELPTSAAIGQDGKIYLGTLGGSVQVVEYDVDTLKMTSQCHSKALKDAKYTKNSIPAVRDILGITFDPRDKEMKPYVSTSTIFWHERERVDRSIKDVWSNGAVDRLKPGTDPTDSGVCLVYDKRIVSGIPVSNHDHSVNGLVFTQNGDLLITVGGNTNMGLPGYKLGGYWESEYSAAVLIARLSKPSFDGDIKYQFPTEPRKAKMISGDVDLYATGLRNSFSITMTGKEQIYATDNGPNCSFGDTSASCSDYDEARAAAWDPDAEVDWEGKVRHGWVSCPFSLSRPDKILHVTPGSWYGHPNINRGGAECAWIDPFDDLTADDKPAPSKYKKAMTTLQSPLTGIGEYRANHFCGKLRGELIMSTYKSGKTWRMGVNGGAVTSGPDQLSSDGGITFVENAHGDLIFPRLSEKDVFVLRPDVTASAGLYVVGAVPFRHGKGGGTEIIVGGGGFGASTTVTIGSKTCVVTKRSAKEMTCTVPAHTSGLKSLTVVSSGISAELPDAVLYMK